MQQDPAFKQMVKKSFILRKTPDLQIPMVKKNAGLKQHGSTTFVLGTLIHLLIYPLDTIKTRVIARHSKIDIAKFHANKVGEATTYLGIFRGYSSILIGNMFHLTIGKQSIALAAIAQGLAKTWIDQSKISKQMNNTSGNMDIMKRSFGICAFYGILRDLTFRQIYFNLSSYLQKRYLGHSKFYDQRKRINNIFFSVIVGTLVSQPFQVCFIKAASQRSLHYDKILDIPIKIVKQQGFGKLLVGGLWARITYNLVSTLILANTYEKTLDAFLEVF